MNESEPGVLWLIGIGAHNFLDEVSKSGDRNLSLVSWVGFKLWGNFQDCALVACTGLIGEKLKLLWDSPLL